MILLPEQTHGSPAPEKVRHGRGKRNFCRGSQCPAQKSGHWKLRRWRNTSRGEFTCFHDCTFRFARVRQVTNPWWTIANGQLDVLCSSARFDGRFDSLAPRPSRRNNDFTDFSCFAVFDGPVGAAAKFGRSCLPNRVARPGSGRGGEQDFAAKPRPATSLVRKDGDAATWSGFATHGRSPYGENPCGRSLCQILG